MNQDQVKHALLKLDGKVENFTVIFSGKSSKKVDGLYYPDRREIIIHNKNFINDNAMIYTAIHEFAHHLHFTRSAIPVSSRAHSTEFWNIFHHLLFDAEKKGVYNNIFNKEPEFIRLTDQIKKKFLANNGDLMKEFGKLLIEAMKLCEEHHASFYDYVDRVLGLHRLEAKSIMNVFSTNVSSEIGFSNMKKVASIRDDAERKGAENAFLEGKSPDMVWAEFSPSRKRPDDMLDVLVAEKNRIEKTLDTLSAKLAKIERKIQEIRFNK